MIRRISVFLLFLLFLAGFFITCLPYINELVFQMQMKETVSDFQQIRDSQSPKSGLEDAKSVSESVPSIYPELWKAISEYNRGLYESGQEGIHGLRNLEESCFTLSSYGVESDAFGVLSIPTLGLEMPIYLGASSYNMSLGAAQLGQTSIPIGGVNTNSVIAGHRGWNGADYFRYIPNLVIGDKIQITNLWETLEYTVTGTKIISPNDVEAIKI